MKGERCAIKGFYKKDDSLSGTESYAERADFGREDWYVWKNNNFLFSVYGI